MQYAYDKQTILDEDKKQKAKKAVLFDYNSFAQGYASSPVSLEYSTVDNSVKIVPYYTQSSYISVSDINSSYNKYIYSSDISTYTNYNWSA